MPLMMRSLSEASMALRRLATLPSMSATLSAGTLSLSSPKAFSTP